MNLIRQGIATSQFFLYGKKYFTQTGYLNNQKHYKDPVQSSAISNLLNDSNNNNDGFDLTNKTILITGANQGIGKEIATYAAAKNAKVYMLCRNRERAVIAQKEIQDMTNNPNVKVVLADVSKPSEIRKVVAELEGMEDKLDCLVCNAGVLLNERQVNSEGMEITLASHLVCGSYQLTKMLLPLLTKATTESGSKNNGGEARVIYVSSGGMYNTKFPVWEEASSTGKYESSYDGNFAYSYAKRGQVLLAERFAKEYPTITFLSCHPGWVRTTAVDAAYGDQAKYLEPMRSTWEGAEGICWLTCASKSKLENGAFYLDRSAQRKHMGGLFMTQGSFTKNTEQEVDVMMKHLRESCGV